jgi:hypothetical protein
MADQPSPRRRIQFRLRTLLIVVTLFALIPCGYVGWQAKIVRERKAWYAAHPGGGFANGARIVACGNEAKAPNLLRRWLGDVANDAITLHPTSTAADIRKATELFPEAVIALTDKGDLIGDDGGFSIYVPKSIGDSELQRLKRLFQSARIKRDDHEPAN